MVHLVTVVLAYHTSIQRRITGRYTRMTTEIRRMCKIRVCQQRELASFYVISLYVFVTTDTNH
jgi:hypothetical protein